MDENRVKQLVHYAVDKASPYALAQHPETDDYSDIAALRLTQLAITEQGIGLIWTWMNAYASTCGAKPVPASLATKCKTVKDVFEAVKAASTARGKGSSAGDRTRARTKGKGA